MQKFKLQLYWKYLFLILIPLLLLPVPLVIGNQESKGAYLVLLMASYWGLELLPLPITALLPVVFLPLFSILETKEVTLLYMKSTCMLYIGGLAVAIAVEHSNLHKRIAMQILLWVGTSPRFLMLGFMLPTAFLSMWISNTATTAMMVPILQSVLTELGADKKVSTMMMLSLAYAANIGGTGTLIGTSPNLVFYGVIKDKCAGQPINFGSWMAFCVPAVIVNLLFCWLWLQLLYLPLFGKKSAQQDEKKSYAVKELLRARKQELGPMSVYELLVSGLFLILVLLWFFREPGFVTGWASLLSSVKIDDSTPVILIVAVLSALPLKNGEPFLPWDVIEKKLGWGIIILMGGGFALAEGMDKCGLNKWIGEQLMLLQDWNDILLLLIIMLVVMVVTQVASNSATASMVMPVLLNMSMTIHKNPLFLMLPATLTCSYAFMLPVSTAPNAIVFNASGMKTLEMIKAGLGMNIITVLTTAALILGIGDPMFELRGDLLPDWTYNCTTSTI